MQDSEAIGLGTVLPLQKAQEVLLMHGVGKVAAAIDLYRASSEQKNPLAEYDLGYFYEKGMGVSRDPAQALVLYRRAFAHATDDRLRLMAEAAITDLEARQTPSADPGAPRHDPAAIDILRPVAVDDPSDGVVMAAPAEVAEVEAETHPTHVIPAALVADLVSRGNEMLRQGDVGTARLLYECAANAGSGKAAIWVARTHDARFLEQIHAIGIASDPAAAADWYRRAAELGDHNADQFLAGVETDGATSFESSGSGSMMTAANLASHQIGGWVTLASGADAQAHAAGPTIGPGINARSIDAAHSGVTGVVSGGRRR
jgi:hypothetical protein